MRGKALMSNIFRIAWKDLMELFRNRLGLIMLILMPIFMMGMVGFIFPSNNSLNHVSVGLVNQDVGFGGSTIGSQVFLTAHTQQLHSMHTERSARHFGYCNR
jgi:ABC-2 type transport system permease protein